MLLVASETGHVYTFATDKLQPMITSEIGKNLIQSCLSYNQDEVAGKEVCIESFNENEYNLDEDNFDDEEEEEV